MQTELNTIFGLLLLFSLTCAASAKACDILPDAQIRGAAEHQNCGKNDLFAQNDINQCAQYRYVLSEQKLNQTVDHIVETLKGDPPGRVGVAASRGFAKAQDAWCKARDANCDFDTATGVGSGGSMAMEIYADCRRERNEARTKALEFLADCLDGADCERPLLLYTYELHPNEKP